MARRKTKPIPAFKSEDEEREFWLGHDTADYLDWRPARRPTMPRL
ncbi:MAG: CopG family antitoxin, partial [Terriglobales bacterium]